ncbi:MAG: glycosyltransferase family 4 protein [Phycisphaerales bacterium]|nr:glycosyltransferase family 4 protein [Phycisphaerales bacterium]
MPRICHLFDAATGWEQRVAVSQLLDRLPRDHFTQMIAAVDPAAVPPLRSLATPLRVFPRFARLNALVAPLFARFVETNRCDVIHAWGPDAAAVAAMASRRPLVVELFDPALASRSVKLLRTLARPKEFGIICSCELVRRRMIEGGVPSGSCVTVRPGIDFAFVNRLRRGPLRERLGISPDDFAILLPDPVTRNAGHFEAFAAGALMNHLAGNVKFIVPGRSPEQQRIARFAAVAPSRPRIITPGEAAPFEQLIPTADALVVPSDADVSTTAIAWAMASRVAVIAAAGYAVAELIANKVNGLLFKRTQGKSSTAALVKLLEDRTAQAKVKEAAHGQAYEVFSLRRCIEQHTRVYKNVISGAAPGEGITDSAQVG